ncbi:MAG: hypothetical protein A2Y10_11920 [Planctomycetes bacterium GWF2_41_51]|nr:MAG: hypothetical protein A2Y10_11920 [Planctomycetes bacterium GWF2_41_51]HBG28652.1 hypothetical protein [Phycisphaerales bacterium]
MTSRECVIKTIKFKSPERLAYKLPDEYGSDIYRFELPQSPDLRPRNQRKFTDEWGAIWENIGNCQVGEVKEYPLKSWDDLNKLKIPNIREPHRWQGIEKVRAAAGGKFLLGKGISIYERIHFLRGLENTWMDIYTNRDDIIKLIDILVDMNMYILDQYATTGFDGIIWNDDWGLQKTLMIPPQLWREIWKPRYEKVYKKAHEYGILTFLHSCGYIIDILDDLIEAGLDVIHMDQQENMGLELLGERFGGRLTFYSPVDIQTVMNQSDENIRNYCRRMVTTLGRPQGGFIPRWYEDPQGAGHTQRAIKVMCEEFLRLSAENNKNYIDAAAS